MGLSVAKANNDAMLTMVRQLQSRDLTVRTHESAHIGAGGGVITSSAHFTYQKGPDGRNYAIGGEVGIDSSPIPGNPGATLTKMAQVKAAALAPAQPSPTDLAVAASATQIEAQARQELARNQAYEAQGGKAGKDGEKPLPEPGSSVDILV